MDTLRKLRQSRLWPVPVGVATVAVLTVLGAYFEAYPHNHYAGLHLVSHPPLIALVIPFAAALSLILVRKHSVPVFFLTVSCAMAWSALGQLDGATLVPVLVALFWVAKEHTLAKSAVVGSAGAIAIWTVNGALGPFGWIGGPGLTMWPEFVVALAIGGIVSARHFAHTEAQERRLVAEHARQEEVHHIVNQERMRIARELHDVVAHTMAMINIQASAVQLLLESDPRRASEAVAEIRSASKSGLQELRSILAIMRPPGQDDQHGEIVPDLRSIQGLVHDWDAAGVSTELLIEGNPRELPAAVALASFRIIQEALTNVARHALNPVTRVRLYYTEASLMIEVVNTSTSMSSRFHGGTGSGLIGMRERVRSLSGTFTAGPLQEGGYQVVVMLPLPQQGNQEALAGPSRSTADQVRQDDQ